MTASKAYTNFIKNNGIWNVECGMWILKKIYVSIPVLVLLQVMFEEEKKGSLRLFQTRQQR